MLPKIEVRTFKVTIPSTKTEVTMRCMKVKEEKILLMAKEGNDPAEILSSVKQVVNNCIMDKVNIDELAIFDIEYMFLQLRAQSISDKTEVAYIDNDEVNTTMSASTVQADGPLYPAELDKAQRKATHTFTIDLNKVEVKFPEKTEKNIKISDKAGIVLKYPPAGLYSDKEFMNSSGEKLIDLLICKSIETVYDGKDVDSFKSDADTKDLKEWIDNLDVKVYNKIKEFFNDLPHLFYEIKYTNKNGKDRTITLTTLNDFFQLV